MDLSVPEHISEDFRAMVTSQLNDIPFTIDVPSHEHGTGLIVLGVMTTVQMCEFISAHLKDEHGLDITPTEVWTMMLDKAREEKRQRGGG
jgi:hypothetical protein